MISIDEFQKVEIRVGKILTVEEIEGSEKLLKLSVDFGEENPRQVISGIKKYFNDFKEIAGVKCAFVTNLEPRSIMGLESQAMILAFSGSFSDQDGEENYFSLMKLPENIPTGSLVH